MRIALISDIHANLPALDAVLDEIARLSVDQTICLGDICDLGPEPSATLTRLRDLACPIIQGNHDPFHEKGPPPIQAVMDWCAEQLSQEEHQFLKSLPATLSVALPGGRNLLAVHGSPRSFNEGLTSDQPVGELRQFLGGARADVVVGGHTHVQMLRRNGKQLIVNTGSVGCPFAEVFSGDNPDILPWAEYAIVEATEKNLSVELRRVDFDRSELINRIVASTMPGKEAWASQWQP